MRRSTTDICYTGMFDRGSLARHVQNCYTYTDPAPMLVEVNCVNENFCLTFTQKFTTDRYVKAFRELLEQHGIACTEIEETELIRTFRHSISAQPRCIRFDVRDLGGRSVADRNRTLLVSSRLIHASHVWTHQIDIFLRIMSEKRTRGT